MLSGPNIADEIVRGLPAAAVVASDDLALAVRLQVAVHSVLFRVYVSDDVAGVELCAAAKNVIALAAGGADGLGARRQREGGARRARPRRDAPARRGGRRPPGHVRGARGHGRPHRHVLGALGAEPSRGRAHRAGRAPDEAAAEIGMVVEGLTTAPVMRDLSQRLEIELPITEGVCAVLEGTSLTELVAAHEPRADDRVTMRARTTSPTCRSR